MCLWQVPQKQLCYLSVVLQSGLALLAANTRGLVATEGHACIKLVPAHEAGVPGNVILQKTVDATSKLCQATTIPCKLLCSCIFQEYHISCGQRHGILCPALLPPP